MADATLYADFLGTWVLIPESCEFGQGDPPVSGLYRIEERGDQLVFRIDWTDGSGEHHHVELAGRPDGVPVPFAGGDAVDALSIEAVSPRELRSSGYWRGEELMVAQRQLDDTGMAMRVTQVVRFLDGTRLANVSVYRRQLAS